MSSRRIESETIQVEKTFFGPNNPAALLSFSLGLFSIFLFEFFVVQIGALVCGGIGYARANAEDKTGGRGAAIAGLVLSLIYLVVAFRSVLLPHIP